MAAECSAFGETRSACRLVDSTIDTVAFRTGVDVEDLGVTPVGRRRIVSVKGGTFEGPRLRGTVLPGGVDWLVERADGVRTLDVRITLRTEDGHLVYAHYPGLFHSPPD